MSRYKAYPEYKDSGIEWMGVIPNEWVLTKTSYFFKIAMGQTILKEDLIDEGEWPVYSATEGDQFFGYINNPQVRLESGDIVIPARGNSIGSVKIVSGKSTATQTTIYCKQQDANKLRPVFVFHYLRGLRDYLFKFTQTAIPQITTEEVGSNPLVLPSIEEQEKIATFLDHETAKIDALIEKQQRLIELLKEKRQAVISHAVTKGLNPNAPMKDSGVEWLGEVPAHWVVARYKFCTSRILVGIAEAATHAYDESGTPIIRSTNIREEGLSQDGMLFIKKYFADQVKSKYLYKDDIVTVRTGYPGISSVVPASLDKSHCFTNLIATPLAKHTSQFLAEYLNSYIGKKYFELNAWGSAQKNISVPILQDFPIAYPERTEEENIEKYIASQKEKFTNLIERAENSISLMQERRTALISAAVTGKIDVRDWQAAA